MQVCPIASARATIGGPSLDSRTACRNASFHRIATVTRGRRVRRPPKALGVRRGASSSAPPAPAAAMNCRRDMNPGGGRPTAAAPRRLEPDLPIEHDLVEREPGHLEQQRRSWPAACDRGGEWRVGARAQSRNGCGPFEHRGLPFDPGRGKRARHIHRVHVEVASPRLACVKARYDLEYIETTVDVPPGE